MKEKLVIDKHGRKYIFAEKDIHTKDGFVKADAVEHAKPGTVLVTNKDVPLHVLDATFIDKYRKLKRGPQIIPLKDLGFIAAEVGIGNDWIIVDAGAGSGGSACFFANLCSNGHIYTFDIREDHHAIVQHNIASLGLKNITAALGNICDGIPYKNVDLVLLDIPSPWEALHSAVTALKHGGWLISYSPTIPQVMDFVTVTEQHNNLLLLKTCEIAEREWDVIGRKVRPKSQSIGHSGFLTFLRRL